MSPDLEIGDMSPDLPPDLRIDQQRYESLDLRIDQQRYESLGKYHEDASSLPFVRYATEQVLNIFSDSRPIPRAKVYDLVSPELRELAKRVIDTMVKHKYLQQKRKGSINMVARTDDCPEIDDHIVHRIWQQVS